MRIPADARKTRINHETYTRHRQGGFCNIGAQYNATCSPRMKYTALLRHRQSRIQGQNLEIALKRLTLPVVSIDDFDELPIPFRAVATDIVTGEAVVIDSGDLAVAMRASMSAPGIFKPVRLDGRILVDGGIVNNLPIQIV